MSELLYRRLYHIFYKLGAENSINSYKKNYFPHSVLKASPLHTASKNARNSHSAYAVHVTIDDRDN